MYVVPQKRDHGHDNARHAPNITNHRPATRHTNEHYFLDEQCFLGGKDNFYLHGKVHFYTSNGAPQYQSSRFKSSRKARLNGDEIKSLGQVGPFGNCLILHIR